MDALKKMKDFKPNRIVCLTEETVETLYLLGEQDRIVGVTGYAVRPPEVRKEKVRVGAFTSADIPKILALNPDLVLTFSDLQADIAAELILKEELSKIYSTLKDKNNPSRLMLSLGKLKSMNIYFSGHIENPGINLVHTFFLFFFQFE